MGKIRFFTSLLPTSIGSMLTLSANKPPFQLFFALFFATSEAIGANTTKDFSLS
jgi:hypothetical protein